MSTHFTGVPEHLIPERAPDAAHARVWVRNLRTGMEWEVEGEHASRLLSPVFGEPEYERVSGPTVETQEPEQPAAAEAPRQSRTRKGGR